MLPPADVLFPLCCGLGFYTMENLPGGSVGAYANQGDCGGVAPTIRPATMVGSAAVCRVCGTPAADFCYSMKNAANG